MKTPGFKFSHVATVALAAILGSSSACKTTGGTARGTTTDDRVGTIPGHLILVGLDQKMKWSATTGLVPAAPGKDLVAVLDLSAPDPRIVATLPLGNSIYGPPTNTRVSPDGRLGLVSNAMKWVQDAAGAWKGEPINQVHILDLQADPPRAVGSVEVGRQPSGLDISADGTRALVTNRADRSVTLLGIDGLDVSVLTTLAVDGEATDAAFTPDGKRALIALFDGSALAVLKVDSARLEQIGLVQVGVAPYSVVITPDGAMAMTGNMGQAKAPDGKPDVVSVVDLQSDPPVLVTEVQVGDGAEGLAISPDGRHAVTIALEASGEATSKDFYHRNARAYLLRLDSAKSTASLVNSVEVGALGEGVVFGPDSRHVYVGNFIDRDLSVLHIDAGQLVQTETRIPLPGQPASLQ